MANVISGQALAGSTIALTGTAAATTTAGPTGFYSFVGLAAGPYVITPTKQGISFTPLSASETIVATDIANVNFLGNSVGAAGSTYTVRKMIDKVVAFSDLEPMFNVAGYVDEPALTIATDVMNEICATPFPHKWNETSLPQFYTTSYQQDYALINPDGSSVYNVEWLQRGVAFDINNSAIPKPWVNVECGRSLPARTGSYTNSGTQMVGFIVSSLPNASLYYGAWGQPNIGNPSLGNNPQPGSIYINPLSAFVTKVTWGGGQAVFTLNYIPTGVVALATMTVTGVVPVGYNGNWTIVSVNDAVLTAPTVTVTMPLNPGTYQAGGIINNSASKSQPANPITQIVDANGNLLLLTTYGVEGTAAPLAAINAPPGTQVSGTGATTVWTVVDPVGLGVRLLEVPSQTGVVWQFNVIGQMPPVVFTSLNQTLFPMPDKYEPFFRAGFIAQSYRYSPEAKIHAKFDKEWPLWQKSLTNMRVAQDRELEEYSFEPQRTIMGGQRTSVRWQGAGWPYPYPRM
jgi:hypothetical protein